MARSKRKSRSEEAADNDNEDENSTGGGGGGNSDDNNNDHHGISLSQMPPEISQDIAPVKASELRNLEALGSEEREKVLMDLSRLILFKALAGEPIDRLKCCKEAGIGSDQGKISSAAFSEAADRLLNVFGFDLKRIPKWMEDNKNLPTKYKDRHFVTQAYEGGKPSQAIYSVHSEVSISNGFLMVVLGMVFCKGDPRSDGSRWILDADLYRLLNALDENIPINAPKQGPAAKKNGGTRRHVGSSQNASAGVDMTPDVDRFMEQFVRLDLLLKEKISEDKLNSMPNSEVDEHNLVYALGPRAAVEIGRKQIIYFCADIMNEDPDQGMLLELDRDEEREGEMDIIEE